MKTRKALVEEECVAAVPGHVREECGCCGQQSFDANTRYSLIAAGWRLLPVMNGGKQTVVWTCPPCWATYKRNVLARKDPSIPAKARDVRMRIVRATTPPAGARKASAK